MPEQGSLSSVDFGRAYSQRVEVPNNEVLGLGVCSNLSTFLR